MLQLTRIANFISKLRLLHYIVIDISQNPQNSPNCSKTSDFSQTCCLSLQYQILLTNWWAVPYTLLELIHHLRYLPCALISKKWS